MSQRTKNATRNYLKKQAIDIIDELKMDSMSWRCDYLDWKNKKQLAAQRSYEQWALDELKEFIRKSNKRPMDATEEFIQKMDDYACMSGNIMFSIAYDAATCALDALLCEDIN